MDDTDLKGEHLQIKHIENERDETNMQRSKHNKSCYFNFSGNTTNYG